MSSIFTPELTAALVAHNRLYDVKEFAKAADALLAEGLALLRAHAGEGDVINRYVATVEKVRAQYRAAKEAPAPAPDVYADWSDGDEQGACAAHAVIAGALVPIDTTPVEAPPRWMRDHRQDARLAVHAGFQETPVGAPSCAEVPDPLHPATSHSYICDAMTDVVVESVKQATAVQHRRNAELVAALGKAAAINTERPGPAHPATGTTCTRCGQVIQSVPFAFPPVATVDGWRHERCPEVPPGPVPVEARPTDTLADLLRWQPTAAEVQAAQLPAAPASEPAVRPGLWERMSKHRPGAPPPSVFKGFCDEVWALEVDVGAHLEGELADEKAAHDMTRDAVKVAVDCENAARTEVDQLRGKLAEEKEGALRMSQLDHERHVRAFMAEMEEATARVRSMREAAAKETERLYGVDNVAAKRIRSLPLDTGTATDTSGEAALPFVPWSKEAEMKESWSAPQADAIKAAVDKANNRAADAFDAWDRRDESVPAGTMSGGEFVEWLRSGEDAPGEVGK